MSSSKFDDASWWRFPVISSGFPASTGWTAACWLGLFFTAIMGVTQEATIQAQTPASGRQRPNIVYLLCDDLGVGDLRSFNAQSKIATPHLDRLAAEGMRLTDAHSGSAVCTPTRYGILCGRYAWRTKLQNGVLGGLSPSLIAADQWTVAKHVKQAGYHSACIGKWHLGLDWQRVDGKEVAELAIESQAQNRNVQFDKPFAGGPLAAGFDEYFGISASLDMVPYVYLKDRAVTVLPTVEKSFGMKFAGDNNQTRPGPGAPDFTADDVLPRLTAEAVGYIERRAATSAAEPFFLYVPFASPHTPIAPSKTWEGKSGLNPYADFVMQQDYCVGQIMQALVRANIDQNTIVFFTSDNGCSPQADLPALRQKGHDPCFPYRGHKADIFEGGHRVPMIVRWPGKIAANTQSAHTVCLTDLLATVADIIGHPLPEQAGPDSFSWWPTLQGQQVESIRPYTIHHSINGSFAIRRGPYKLCLCADSGGWSDPKPNAQRAPTEALQLYNLDKDIAESANLAGEEPKVVRELAQLLEQSVRQGRSTAGPALNNDVPVDPWKHSRRPNSLD